MLRNLSNLTEIDKEKIRLGLHEKFKVELVTQVAPEEKLNLSNAIKSIQYPYSVKDILVYINKNTAELLANSLHPTLQKYGKQCKTFYESPQPNKFIMPETGIVTTGHFTVGTSQPCGGYIPGGYSSWSSPYFNGHGVWDIKNNVWVGSPITPFTGNVTSYISAPNPGQSPFELLTPPHIAALTGDIALLDHLANLGHSLDSKLNAWSITPLELAVNAGQLESVNYLLQKNVTEDLEKIQLLAVKNASMPIIEVFLKHGWLSQAVLEAARDREPVLFNYLDEMQRRKVDDLLKQHSPLNAFQTLLNSPGVPIQLLADFIAYYPDLVMKPIADDLNENTLLHVLVSEKAETKVKILLEAMYGACYLDIPDYHMNCEKKNKQGFTVLDISLANGVNNITSAIMSYGNLTNLSDDQQDKLVATKINIGFIKREREARELKLAQQDHKTLVKLQHYTMDNLSYTLALENQLRQTKEELRQTREELMFMSNNIMHLYKQLNMQIPDFAKQDDTNIINFPQRLCIEEKPEINPNGFFVHQNVGEKEQVQVGININNLI